MLIATYRTKVVDGVTCRVVFDRVWTNGRLSERTHDFYAQTKRGTVWYFGENTSTLDRHGHVTSHEGSFRSGVQGAEAGIFMTPHPHRGPSFRQEDFPGHAEDVFTVVRRGAHVEVPLLDTHHALLTRETTALEPGVVDHKYYVRDLGDRPRGNGQRRQREPAARRCAPIAGPAALIPAQPPAKGGRNSTVWPGPHQRRPRGRATSPAGRRPAPSRPRARSGRRVPGCSAAAPAYDVGQRERPGDGQRVGLTPAAARAEAQ